MEGAQSPGLPELREMETVFRAAGFPVEIQIIEGLEHWYPDDLTGRLEAAVSYIMNA
jgi:hypothetical protein